MSSSQKSNLPAAETKSQQEGDRLSRREWISVLGLTLLAFIIRLLMVRFNTGLSGDGVWYATLGKNLISGNIKEGLSAYWPPLYPFLIGVSSLVFSDLEFAGRFVSVLAGSLLVVPVYLLCRNLYDKEVAFVASLLVAIHALLISSSTDLLTESTYTLLFTTSILLGLFALLRGRVSLFFLTGLSFTACYLVKPEAIGYIGLMTLLTLSARLYRRRVQTRKVLLSSLLLLAGFIILAGPYILYIHQQTGRWTISEKFSANLSTADFNWRRLTPDGQATRADILWGGFRPESPAPEPSQSAAQTSHSSGGIVGKLKKLAQIPVQSAKGFAGEYELFSQVVSPFFILFAGLGLFRSRWTSEQAGRQIYLILFVLATLFGYSLTALQGRYLVPLLPIFLCWTAKGIIEFEAWLAESFRPASKPGFQFLTNRKLVRWLVIAVLFFSMLPAIMSFMKKRTGAPKTVAIWIKERSAAPPVIMASGPWAAFWSGGKHFYLPDEEYPVVIDYARRKKVKYIVIEEAQIWRTSRLKFLLDEQSRPPDLRLVYKYEKAPSSKVLVFELTDAAATSDKEPAG